MRREGAEDRVGYRRRWSWIERRSVIGRGGRLQWICGYLRVFVFVSMSNYLYDTTIHYTTLHYTTLHYTALHYTVLHCTTLQ